MSTPADAPVPAPLPATHPEEQGLPYRLIVAVAAVTLCVFAVSILWATHLLRVSEAQTEPQGAPPIPKQLDQPEVGEVNQRLFELDSRADERRERQLQRLGSYGWVDQRRQVAHIPIERAMELIVQQGLRP